MDLIGGNYWYDDFALTNLVWLLGGAFSEEEFRIIAGEIIDKGKDAVRNKIPSQFSKLFANASPTIVKQLSKPQLLQVALLRSDEIIAAAIDQLVAAEQLKIPPTEIRRPIASAPSPSWTGVVSECSDLGVRVVGRGQIANPLARLKRLILEIHNTEERKAQLEWSLRNIPGSNVGEQLDSMIARETPSKLLRQMVVSNIYMLKSALSHLHSEHLPLPSNDSGEIAFVQKLLWKLGFNKSEFSSPTTEFWLRLRQFEQVVSAPNHEDTSWISAVRSVGVNLFVGLEQLLDKTLSFMCWVFLADPLVDKHTYNPRKGRALMATHLSGLIETDKGYVNYDEGGKNTMFPLIVGFKAISRCIARILNDREKHAKPALVLAHYYGKSSLQLFPYKHHAYICDATKHDVDSINGICDEIALKLQHSKVFEIRNKLEHNNEELPNAKEMLRCAELLAEVVSVLEEWGLLPVIFANQDVTFDSFQRTSVLSRDGQERVFKWQPSPVLKGIKSLPEIGAPQIIVPKFKVPDTNEPLRFYIEEDSEYTKMWLNYPKFGERGEPVVEPAPAKVTSTSTNGNPIIESPSNEITNTEQGSSAAVG
jgi:hypothetical protein